MRKSGRNGSGRNGSSRRALITASVASMLDLFNMENIRILQSCGYRVEAAANFSFGSITSPERVEAFRQELERMNIPVHDIPVPRCMTDIPNIIRSYRMLKRLCSRREYDLVHTQSPIGGALTRLAVAAVQKSRNRGRKKSRKGMHAQGRPYVIYTAHGFHFYRGAPLHCWLLFYPVERWLSRYTDALVTINQEDFRRARKFHAGRVFRIPGVGADLSGFRSAREKRDRRRAEFGFRDRDFVVLSVGQLSKRKNQETVIKAVALLNGKSADREKSGRVCYVIAGIGELEHKYRKLITEMGLEKTVFLAGYRSDVPDLLQMADCFAFPSLQEGLPAALMEAMAAGVPVVCSRIRGNCDLVRDGTEGILLEPHDVEGFAQAIGQIRSRPGLAEKYRRNAGKRIAAFSKEEAGWRMMQIYKDVERKRQGSRANDADLYG